MRRLLFLAVLAVGSCGDYEPSSDDGGGSSPESPLQWVDTSSGGGGGTGGGRRELRGRYRDDRRRSDGDITESCG